MCNITHDELVEKGAKWLENKGCSVVITDMTHSTSETPDCIGWKSKQSILLEAKISRADFLKDKKKFFRKNPKTGMASLRYFICPKNLVTPEELPKNWGLIEWNGKSLRIKHRPSPFKEHNTTAETSILLSAIRRIGQNPPEGISVKAYTIQTKQRATIGIKKDITQAQDDDEIYKVVDRELTESDYETRY